MSEARPGGHYVNCIVQEFPLEPCNCHWAEEIDKLDADIEFLEGCRAEFQACGFCGSNISEEHKRNCRNPKKNWYRDQLK